MNAVMGTSAPTTKKHVFSNKFTLQKMRFTKDMWILEVGFVTKKSQLFEKMYLLSNSFCKTDFNTDILFKDYSFSRSVCDKCLNQMDNLLKLRNLYVKYED